MENNKAHRAEGQDLYTIAEVADILRTSQKAVRRHVAADEIASIKAGASYRIPVAALERFLSDRGEGKLARNYDLFGNVVEEGKRAKKPAGDIVNWVDIAPYWDAPTPSDMTFVDLFCGAGGLSKGLEMAGMEGICGLDWFDEAGQTYRHNFKHPFVNGDIRLPEKKREFYATVRERLRGRKLSVVAGGFPCQGFSMAGNRIVNDERNSLYLEMLEIVSQLRPDFVVCENVKGLRSMLGGKVERKILEDYRRIGYEMNVTTLCAADYYTPQKRERVIFVGNRLGARNYHPKPMLTPDRYITTGEAIGDLVSHPEDPGFNHVPTRHKAFMEKRIMDCPEGASLYKGYSDAWKKCPWDEASCTIKENHGGVNLHPKLPRVLTAREMARLQSFPDDFIFQGTKNKQLVQIGNAVPCLLGKAIGLAVRHAAHDFSEECGWTRNTGGRQT